MFSPRLRASASPRLKKIAFFISLLLSLLSPLHAQFEEDIIFIEENPACQSLEGVFAYTPRSPNHIYDDIRECYVKYTNKMMPGFTVQATGATYWRSEGKGALGSLAAYVDWSPEMYTYTALSRGTNSEYLPEFRADQEFYFKFGECGAYVVPFGITFIKFYDPHRVWSLSSGLNYYCGRWLLSYRAFFHFNHPGSCFSFSNKVGINYGEEGLSRTSLDISWGREAFELLEMDYDVPASRIDRPSFGALLTHKYWLCDDYGVIGELGYTWVKSPYILYRIALGMFIDF